MHLDDFHCATGCEEQIEGPSTGDCKRCNWGDLRYCFPMSLQVSVGDLDHLASWRGRRRGQLFYRTWRQDRRPVALEQENRSCGAFLVSPQRILRCAWRTTEQAATHERAPRGARLQYGRRLKQCKCDSEALSFPSAHLHHPRLSRARKTHIRSLAEPSPEDAHRATACTKDIRGKKSPSYRRATCPQRAVAMQNDRHLVCGNLATLQGGKSPPLSASGGQKLPRVDADSCSSSGDRRPGVGTTSRTARDGSAVPPVRPAPSHARSQRRRGARRLAARRSPSSCDSSSKSILGIIVLQ